MMVPKFVDLWLADAEGTAVSGPIFAEMRFRDTPGEVEISVAPTVKTRIVLPNDYRYPLEMQAYGIPDEELLWTQPLHIFVPGGEFELGGWDGK